MSTPRRLLAYDKSYYLVTTNTLNKNVFRVNFCDQSNAISIALLFLTLCIRQPDLAVIMGLVEVVGDKLSQTLKM